ncbi:MAG: Formamidopyrimidine-DNA glycosylase [Syntrophomonadaceae bacterium]|nr:Formamidopyrimidine-DNA glycosylase [Bacillota bacterium]
MPELPEVETIRRGLEEVLPGLVFAVVEIISPGPLKDLPTDQFAGSIVGEKVLGIERRGKYLLLNLVDGCSILIHLRMTGRLVFSRHQQQADRHTCLLFHFTDGSCLSFSDIRKFGTVTLLTAGAKSNTALSMLGPEPLSGDFNFPYLDRELEKRVVSVKALLLNQRVIAGLGNIYVDEILHRAAIRPERRARSLDRKERLALFRIIREVLEEAVNCRGTTMSDYRDATGSAGTFQGKLLVYGRMDRPCFRCGTAICRSRVAGRGTHFCPECQK